ncbi:hypothetical protein LEMLEM_LOCUS560, partial [Lemmus lemmus]
KSVISEEQWTTSSCSDLTEETWRCSWSEQDWLEVFPIVPLKLAAVSKPRSYKDSKKTCQLPGIPTRSHPTYKKQPVLPERATAPNNSAQCCLASHNLLLLLSVLL